MSGLRIINYEKFVAEKKANFFSVSARLGRHRLPTRRPRDKKERENLMKLDKKRLETKIANGELIIISPRYFRVKIFN